MICSAGRVSGVEICLFGDADSTWDVDGWGGLGGECCVDSNAAEEVGLGKGSKVDILDTRSCIVRTLSPICCNKVKCSSVSVRPSDADPFILTEEDVDVPSPFVVGCAT